MRYKTEMPLPPAIAVAIEAGDTIITASARATRALRLMHGEAQREQGRQAWKSPDILDWESWLHRLWQKKLRSGGETRLLLSPLQEQQVWVRQIKPDIENRYLISVMSVSELAQEAYALLCAYRALDFLSGELGVSHDVEDFRRWARSFEQTCRREGWLCRGQLPMVLHDAVIAGQIKVEQRLVLIGFDRLTPAQQHLIEAVSETGQPIEIAEARAESPQHGVVEEAMLVEAEDSRHEITSCALWLRRALAARQPAPRIAVVVPGITGMRPEIERIFRQVLAPQAVAIGPHDLPLPFEFSLGVPLAGVPMVRAALLLLRWMQQPILQDEASWLLLSGFVSEDRDELLLLARFDARLRQQTMRQPEQELDELLHYLGKSWRESIPLAGLRNRLRRTQRMLSKNALLSYAEWAGLAQEMLETAHWPGAHALQSEEFQVQARWSHLLDEVGALAFDGSKVRYSAFLDVLEQQAGKTIFAPESREAPIQILGPLEAAGLTFDALWFLNADDASWPAMGRPHPFLSRTLQRKHEMPHANGDVDWKLAQQVTLRLERSAARCVFSYAAQNAEGACRPSTLLAPDKQVVQAAAFRRSMGEEGELLDNHDFPRDEPEEEPAVIAPWPAEKDAGGSEVLKDQAACAFRAFATRRLGARAIDDGDWGLDARSRGSVAHTILENLWAELKNRDSLIKERREGHLPEIVERHVTGALQHYRTDGPKRGWNQAYLGAERERIVSLIEEWLAYEETRAYFSVEAREDKRALAVGDLKLQVRVDRIDAIQGGCVIIDYKTGEVKTDVWEGPRLDEPQLPLYAGYGQVDALRGVLLAKVVENKVRFAGCVEDAAAVAPGDSDLAKPPYSEEMLRGWQGVLLDLAQQFLRGEAQVNPKQYPKTCRYCDLQGLCRIAESNQSVAEDVVGVANGESE